MSGIFNPSIFNDAVFNTGIGLSVGSGIGIARPVDFVYSTGWAAPSINVHNLRRFARTEPGRVGGGREVKEMMGIYSRWKAAA